MPETNERQLIENLLVPLWDDIGEKDQFNIKKPLLAHYTSIPVFEEILRNNEIWFSNPLFMNDIEEVRYGIITGEAIVRNNPVLKSSLKTIDRNNLFQFHFNKLYNDFSTNQVMDTYVLCLSEHNPQDLDGRLSMWRGYGKSGDGIAIVIDTSKLELIKGSPFIFSKVSYATTEQRNNFLENLILKLASILENTPIPDKSLAFVAFMLFERIKQFSLFTKHYGFHEEDEWRVVYTKGYYENHKIDTMFSYWVGPRGLEPKLKFKLNPIDGLTGDISLINLVDRLILGPTASSPLTLATLYRVCDLLGFSELKNKICTSTIPFRGM